ncbi:uncharacterized protein [Musca autumnalis]|uniref:uncharacterized protein n=1 Tax=Musca autumnalis TaxID=221902 RepID=UPI003CEA3B36
MCLILTTGTEDGIMETAAKSMKGMRYIKTIFVLFPKKRSEATIYGTVEAIFNWAWRKQYINTLLVTRSNNIFIYEPYPVANILNITNKWSARNFFNMANRRDFKGYVIHTPVYQDFPRVFYMHRQRAGVRNIFQLSGVSGNLFTTFLRHINATLNDTTAANASSERKEPFNISRIIEMVADKKLEISVNSFTSMLIPTSGVSYPMGINDWCLMVPYQNPTPDNKFMRRTLQTSTLLMIAITFFYISLGIWLCSPYGKRDLSLSFLQAIGSLMLTTPMKILQLPRWRMRLIFIVLFVFGFHLTNLYLSTMASLLTASSEPPQIDTIEDVIAARLPIMITDYEYEALRTYHLPQKFMDLIIVVNKLEMDQHRDCLNTSFGYSTQTDRWKFLDSQQRFLKKPLFRLSKICVGPFYHVYPLQRDSHLARSLKNFIILSTDMGLLPHWEKETFADALFLGYVHMMKLEDHLMPLNLNFFRSIWIIWCMGLICSIVVFIFEVKWVLLCEIFQICVNLLKKLRNKIFEK